MNARPILATIARAFREHGIDAVLIGNAAAAMHGAPVTTVDFDFLFRKTPANLKTLKALARALQAVIFTPQYPASGLFRLIRDEDGLQLDFMRAIHCVRSFNGLRGRAHLVGFDGENCWLPLWLISSPVNVQPIGRVIGRFSVSLKRRASKRKVSSREKALADLKRESDLALKDQIRRLLTLPMDQRTHFLRRKIGFTGSCL